MSSFTYTPGQVVQVNIDDDCPVLFTGTIVQDSGTTVVLVEFPRVHDELIRPPDDPTPVSDDEHYALLSRQYQAEGRVWLNRTRIHTPPGGPKLLVSFTLQLVGLRPGKDDASEIAAEIKEVLLTRDQGCVSHSMEQIMLGLGEAIRDAGRNCGALETCNGIVDRYAVSVEVL